MYETKPLPPVPARRSWNTTFSCEVNRAFETPKSSVYYHDINLRVPKQDNPDKASWNPFELEQSTMCAVLAASAATAEATGASAKSAGSDQRPEIGASPSILLGQPSTDHERRRASPSRRHLRELCSPAPTEHQPTQPTTPPANSSNSNSSISNSSNSLNQHRHHPAPSNTSTKAMPASAPPKPPVATTRTAAVTTTTTTTRHASSPPATRARAVTEPVANSAFDDDSDDDDDDDDGRRQHRSMIARVFRRPASSDGVLAAERRPRRSSGGSSSRKRASALARLAAGLGLGGERGKAGATGQGASAPGRARGSEAAAVLRVRQGRPPERPLSRPPVRKDGLSWV